MLPSTMEILKSVLRSDPTLSPTERAALLMRLKDKSETAKPNVAPPLGEIRIVRRTEAARRLACSLRTIDSLAASGVLPRRKLPGRVRGSGFLSSDVEALMVVGLPPGATG